MVDEQEMRTLLEQSGIPFKYHHWNKAPNSEPPPIPFGVFVFYDSNNLIADGAVYHKGHRVRKSILKFTTPKQYPPLKLYLIPQKFLIKVTKHTSTPKRCF